MYTSRVRNFSKVGGLTTIKLSPNKYIIWGGGGGGGLSSTLDFSDNQISCAIDWFRKWQLEFDFRFSSSENPSLTMLHD